MNLHPITVIEITFTMLFISALFATAFFIPKKKRKLGFYTAGILTSLVLVFFMIRPLWIHYQVSIKKEQLTHYLTNQYPGEEWNITQNIGRQYNPYIFLVEFQNEKGWNYHYYVKDALHITQNGLSTPDGVDHIEGKHYQPEDW
ncbi:hypothetical protein AWM68_09265 [Fictibacillus phosphorivorans]|uniref:DUF3139 domain-containing protein n=1 Tax=Fictibacillus phosphorivorans TaxID=1221500 RepID=A0A163QAW6_9BACL|nr:hypothetical protein [Fictibacillus phosphorivorans]KZE64835.1 hypothetical protein AWM68_09265 [Fictibacillus phosphorivorans]